MMTRTPRLRLFGWLLLVTSLMLASCTQQNRPQPASTESNTRAALVTDLDVDNARVASGSGVEQILSAPTSRGGFQESNELGPLGFSASLSSVTDSGFLTFIRHTPSAPDPWELLLLEDEVAGPVTVYSGDREIQSTAVSLDGEYVVFSMMDAPTGGDFQVYRLDVSSLTLEQLTSDAAENTNVSITADGSTIVWEADSPSSARGVVIREYSGVSYNQLTLSGPVDLVEPSISADGKWLALIYTFAANDLAASLYSVDADSLQFVDDGSPAVRRFPSVSRNGASVLWLEPGSSSGNSVKLATTSTSIVAEVLNVPDPVEHPFLSAPGNHFAYVSTVGGDSNVYIHDIDANTSSQWATAPSGSASYGVYWQFSPTVSSDCGDLTGAPASSAASAIPDCAFRARAQDYALGRPHLENVPWSFNTLLVAFEAATTVLQAEALLTSIDAEIVGGVSGSAWQEEGVLIIRVPLTTHTEMISLVNSLRPNPIVAIASPDALVGTDAVPQTHSNVPNSSNPIVPDVWTWNTREIESWRGNYGHSLVRVPQLWNLNAAIEKHLTRIPHVAIYDDGFAADHPDLTHLAPYAGVARDHGTFVAGIIGATFNNTDSNGGVGIEGVNPFVNMLPLGYMAEDHEAPQTVFDHRVSWWESMVSNLRDVIDTESFVRVINVSLGYSWSDPYYDGTTHWNAVNQNLEPSLHAEVHAQGAATYWILNTLSRNVPASLPLMVVSAGNDSDDGASRNQFGVQSSMWNSPLAYAALGLGSQDILVVESVDWNKTRSLSSNIDGHISAPGHCVLSTNDAGGTGANPSPERCRNGNVGPGLDGRYAAKTGTSFAAPYVAGIASYLLALDSTLSNSDLRYLLLTTGQPAYPHITAGGQPANTVDAFHAALAIDQLRGDNAILAMLLDIDDGTPDGNQRVLISSEGFSGTDDINGDGIIDGSMTNPAPLVLTNIDFGEITSTSVIGEDVDGDRGVGDGRIGMSDFRRWRDWYLGAKGLDENLDGSAGHFKRDVNSHPQIGVTPVVDEYENVFPRGDFNGDGRLSLSEVAPVPGFATDVTDLEVLQQSGLWNDDFYHQDDLSDLVMSGDLEIFIRDLYDLPGDVQVASYVYGDLSPITRLHTATYPSHVYTLPEGIYTAAIQVMDSNGRVILEMWKPFEIEVGGDSIWGPLVSLDSDIVDTYNGPLDDCPRLEGLFSIDIKGLFEDPAPPIALTPTNAAMEINGSLFNIADYTIVNSIPFEVNAETMRNCNVQEGSNQILGLVLEFEDGPNSTGFYAHIYDTFTNVDNQWPTYTWNRTDLSTNPGICPIVPLDIETNHFAGRIVDPQGEAGVSPGAYTELLMTFETTYEQVFIDSTTDPQNPVEILRGFTNPPYIDSKFTYNGVDQWIHSIGYWLNPSCEASPLSLPMAPEQPGGLEIELRYETELSDPSHSHDLMRNGPLQQR